MPANDSVHVTKFKNKAKSLHKAVKAGEEDALQRIAPYFDKVSEFKLTQAQLVIARELHCPSWKALTSTDAWLQCSFCKKWQYELAKLIAGPDVYVCDECVELCNEILRGERDKGSDAHA